MPEQFDAIVIGAGQAGVPLAKAMAEHGWKTAMIERKWIGGTCVNVGCTPTKTMVGNARVAYQIGRAAEFGVVLPGSFSVDMAKVRERKDGIVLKSRHGNEKRLSDAGVETLFGEASFTGPSSISVAMNDGGTRELTAKHIMINTGTRPALPDLDGLEGVPYLTNESIMELDAVPEHLIVLGASYIALEFGQMFRRFGSKVTVIERGERFLPREDMDIEEELLKILREDGIEVLLCGHARCTSGDAQQVTLELGVHDAPTVVTGTHLLVAVGRTPNSDRLALDKAGIATDKHGYIPVNDRLETGVPGVYALGDVKGGPAFTHISYDDFRIIRANLLNNGNGDGGNTSTKNREINYTMFTDPELGRIGLNEQEAREQGRKIRVASCPVNYMARANEQGDPRGLLKVVIDADTDLILGASMLSIDGGELAAMIQIAMMGGLKYQQLREAVWSHPAKAEVLNTIFGYIRE